MVADDNYSMKLKLHNYYTKLIEKEPNFVWPRFNGRKLGRIDLNIPDPEFIAEPTN